jgi:hypothetical protein
MPSNLLAALPSTFRSQPVIPYAPNGPDDRGHVWDWTGRTAQIPSGITTASVDALLGTESFALRYVGLTRADARALESFVEGKSGRITGFWCPTFQHDFYASGGVAGSPYIREWGFAALMANVQSSAGAYIHRPFAAFLGGAWGMSRWSSFTSSGTDDSGYPRSIYTVDGFWTVGTNVWGTATNGYLDGLRLMRVLWCRFADDPLTTSWDHPALANIELRVVTIPQETPL